MLNFSHSRLLEKLASDLLAQAPKITPVYVVRYLRSFATLRWFSLPLFDATTQVRGRVGEIVITGPGGDLSPHQLHGWGLESPPPVAEGPCPWYTAHRKLQLSR